MSVEYIGQSPAHVALVKFGVCGQNIFEVFEPPLFGYGLCERLLVYEPELHARLPDAEPMPFRVIERGMDGFRLQTPLVNEYLAYPLERAHLPPY